MDFDEIERRILSKNGSIPKESHRLRISNAACRRTEDEDGDEFSLSVSPRVLSVSRPGEKKADVKVRNWNSFPVYFKVYTTNAEVVRVQPSTGEVQPREELPIRVYRYPSSRPIRLHEEILLVTSASTFERSPTEKFVSSWEERKHECNGSCMFCDSEPTKDDVPTDPHVLTRVLSATTRTRKRPRVNGDPDTITDDPSPLVKLYGDPDTKPNITCPTEDPNLERLTLLEQHGLHRSCAIWGLFLSLLLMFAMFILGFSYCSQLASTEDCSCYTSIPCIKDWFK